MQLKDEHINGYTIKVQKEMQENWIKTKGGSRWGKVPMYKFEVIQDDIGKTTGESQWVQLENKQTITERIESLLKNTERYLKFLPFGLDDIEMVYVGRPGCMCGCKGKYYYAKKEDADDGAVVDFDKVKRVYNKFKNLETSGKISTYDSHNNKIFSITSDTSNWVIYLKGH